MNMIKLSQYQRNVISHINNLGLYAYIQHKLGGIGRFQHTGSNTIRYIIGDIKSIQLIINLIHGKLRTPKNKRLNDVINFINNKYFLEIFESPINTTDLIITGLQVLSKLTVILA